jgi:hypothetical protein
MSELVDTEERWLSRPEQTHVGSVNAFVLWHLNATTDDDFAGDFGLSVGVFSREEEHPLPIYSVVVGVEGSTGRRLSNVLLDAAEARQLAWQLLRGAKEADRLHAETWTSEAEQEYMAQMARAVLPNLTDEQLIAGGLSEDEVRQVREMRDEST